MRKTIVLILAGLLAQGLSVAQATKKHKPSAAVRTTSKQKAPASKSTSAKSTLATPDTVVGATAGTTPASTFNGPVYEDEKQPTPVAKMASKTESSITPSELPTGTAIWMNLQTPLSSRDNREGDPFSGRVTQPVVVGGKTVIPVGASIAGRLLRVSDPRRFHGSGSLRLLPETVMLPNGRSYAINAVMVDSSIPKQLTVDDEGRIKSKGISVGDKIEMITGSGTGAIIGTIAGGGKGFLIGTMIGGGAAAIHWMSKRHPVEVPAGTELIMEISRPMTMSNTPMVAGN